VRRAATPIVLLVRVVVVVMLGSRRVVDHIVVPVAGIGRCGFVIVRAVVVILVPVPAGVILPAVVVAGADVGGTRHEGGREEHSSQEGLQSHGFSPDLRVPEGPPAKPIAARPLYT